MNDILEQMKADLGPILSAGLAFGVGTEAMKHGMDVMQWQVGPVQIATAFAFGITMLIGTRMGRRPQQQ